ncbi:MAG: hypothetical protein JW776_10405 [Candidatus Lokiarchaeota archaeon]|nr:hypothetical protein [Candidatus Lokiarchaeota archaeon]
MKKLQFKTASLVLVSILIGLVVPFFMLSVRAEGPPSQEEVFNGHTYDENYWDIMVFNNSNWEVEDPSMGINNQTTWLNNTWNIKWISEGNFEMGFLAFMNKSGIDNDPDAIVFTPAQFWYMHYYYEGHEMLIGNMLSAWFGWGDHNHNGIYEEGDEEITPFFYMTMIDENWAGKFPTLAASLDPDVIVTPMERSVSGNEITYSWAYNYTDVCFYLPEVNRTLLPTGAMRNDTFEWGFEYNDPGTYLDGSRGFGVQEFIYYEYTLVLNIDAGTSTLTNDYIGGEVTHLYMRDNQVDPFTLILPEDSEYIPDDWALCIGSYALIMAGVDEDYSLLNTTGSEINTQTTNHGLTTVSAVVTGEEVFNYEFEQKPDYTQYEWGNPSNSTTNPVIYESLDIVGNEEFINLVSGMTQLIGPFAQLMISYAVNQTNHFTNGITFDDAWDYFDPESTAALFVSCYPNFGEYKGGRLEHDPVFLAFFDIRGIWGKITRLIPGYHIFILLGTISLGVSVFALKLQKKT